MRTSYILNLKKIVHLDDHSIILKGIDKTIMNYNPQYHVTGYTNSDEAFATIVKGIIDDQQPDLFITDFSHPGLNGYEMCKAIRSFERGLNRKPMPIMLLTMHLEDMSLIQEGLKEGLFTKYLSLGSPAEALMSIVSEMLAVK